LDRRNFLWTAAGLIGAAAGAPQARTDDKPPAASPRATSGDAAEPKWEQRLTVTVGPRDADLAGKDDKVLQAAVDYVARLGGGTVHVLPGTYRLRNAVYLQRSFPAGRGCTGPASGFHLIRIAAPSW
jgi:hypothetical protein